MVMPNPWLILLEKLKYEIIISYSSDSLLWIVSRMRREFRTLRKRRGMLPECWYVCIQILLLLQRNKEYISGDDWLWMMMFWCSFELCFVYKDEASSLITNRFTAHWSSRCQLEIYNVITRLRKRQFKFCMYSLIQYNGSLKHAPEILIFSR